MIILQFSERKTNLLKMADEFDIDDLLEAPYQKVKNEETEVNINRVLFCFLIQIKTILNVENATPVHF